jgi:hypothetical protein
MEIQKLKKIRKQKWRTRITLAVFIMVILIHRSECQISQPSNYVFKGGLYEETFSTSRIGLAQSVMTTPKSEFHIVVQHRFGEISGDVNEFFGLDNASTRLGFDYGIFNWLSAGVGRSMQVKMYDLSLKTLILKQKKNIIPLSLSWYFSFLENTYQSTDWDGHDTFGSRLGYVSQLFISRNQGFLSFQVSPLWVHSNYDHRVDGSMDVFAIDLDSRIRLSEKLGIIAEYIPILTDNEFTKTNPFTLGLDINTGGHQFQLILSNSQGTNEKTILTETAGSWTKGHIYFGFNLTRVFNSKTD